VVSENARIQTSFAARTKPSRCHAARDGGSTSSSQKPSPASPNHAPQDIVMSPSIAQRPLLLGLGKGALRAGPEMDRRLPPQSERRRSHDREPSSGFQAAAERRFGVAPAGTGSPSPNCQKWFKLPNLWSFFSQVPRREATFAMTL